MTAKTSWHDIQNEQTQAGPLDASDSNVETTATAWSRDEIERRKIVGFEQGRGEDRS
jgi:hypothetical protein